MTLPLWLTAVGAGLGGAQQAQQRQQDQQRQQQMVQALMQQRGMQSPGGLGATPATTGPQNWGAQNQVSNGVVHDQWGNPIGPAGQAAQAPGQVAIPPAAAPPAQAGQPDIWSQGAGATPFAAGSNPSLLSASQPPGLSPTPGVPFMGGPSQATPPQGAGGFQAPADPMNEAIMSALFAPQGA